MFKVKKKDTSKTKVVENTLLGLNKLYTLFESFYVRFQKASKFHVLY